MTLSSIDTRVKTAIVLPPRDAPVGVGVFRLLVVIVLIGLPRVFGALRAFPLYDDGWLLMLTKESGPAILADTMPDRPLFGLILRAAAEFGARTHVVYVVIASLIWAIFALQAGLLWNRLFPSLKQYAPLVTCMTVAPIVLQTQLCTALVAIPAVLPSLLAYSALLFVLRSVGRTSQYKAMALSIALVLAIVGVALSEYAIAGVASGIVILGVTFLETPSKKDRKSIAMAAGLLALVTIVSYAVFLHFTNLGTSRPSVSPQFAREAAQKSMISIGLNLANGMWNAVIGAYGKSLGTIALYWDSKSSILGVFYGLAIALTLVLQSRRARGTGDIVATRPIKIGLLLLALAVGLAPVALMGRGTTLPGFGSRFVIPVMPVAAMLTTLAAVRMFKKEFLWIPIGLLGLVSGNAAIAATTTAIRDYRFVSSIGSALKPYVSIGEGHTVAVISENGMDYELTARATANWPVDLERKFWLYDVNAGRAAFGPRTKCTNQTMVQKDVRLLKRNGPIERLLWVEVQGEKLIAIEPYCKQGDAVE